MATAMQSVDSSQIAKIGYDGESSKLVVEFKKGGTYSYSDVPPNVFEGLANSDSKGKYLHNFIKPHYTAERVE